MCSKALNGAEVCARLLNVCLRLCSMVSRFLLVFGLAYFLDPKELGEYGLFAVSIGFSVLLIGGDFYTYSHRELLSSKNDSWCFILQHHVTALLLIYLLLLPLQLTYFWFGLLSWKLCGWFFLLLISEHLAQEMNRLLIAVQEPLMASLVLLIRMGVWVWFLLPWMLVEPNSRGVENVFLFWFVGSLSAVIFACFLVYKKIEKWTWSKPDFGWIKKGFGVGSLFLVSALSFKALTTIDRFFVEYLMNLEMLGVYVLFLGMAMSINSIMDSAIFSFLYPQVVRAWRTASFVDFHKMMNELWFVTIVGSVFLAFAIGISAPWVLSWIDKGVYLEHFEILAVLLIAAVVYSVGLVPHYGLYAKGGDKDIMKIHLSSLLVLMASIGIVMQFWVEGSVAVALFLTFCWIGSAKYMLYTKIEPNKENRP
jgi:O-antigen/teichoic acid export membrane protein